MKEYDVEYRSGARLKSDPYVCFHELERIRVKYSGKLTPKAVVKESKPTTAPLHCEFEWCDAVAAENYRVWQARNIIKTVVINSAGNGCEKVTVPVFIHTGKIDPDGTETPYYQRYDIARRNPTELEMAIKEAERKLLSARMSLVALHKIASMSNDSVRTESVNLALKLVGDSVTALSA